MTLTDLSPSAKTAEASVVPSPLMEVEDWMLALAVVGKTAGSALVGSAKVDKDYLR